MEKKYQEFELHDLERDDKKQRLNSKKETLSTNIATEGYQSEVTKLPQLRKKTSKGTRKNFYTKNNAGKPYQGGKVSPK